MTVKLCNKCKWSVPEVNATWNLRCTNEEVNKKDPWALSAVVFSGSSCREERESRFFAACGMKGKLWEAKNARG